MSCCDKILKNPTQLLKSIVLLLSTTPGRDKTCRVVQYSCRFFAAVIRHQIAKGTMSKEQFDTLAGRIERLSGNMSLTRKVLRFGRPIGLAMTFLDLSKQLSLALSGKGKPGDVKSHPVHIACKMGSMLSLITFFLLDHILYLARVDLMDKRPELVSNCDYYSCFAWFLDCVFGLITNTMEIKSAQAKLQAQKALSSQSSSEGNQEDAKNLQASVDGAVVDLARNVFDLPVAIGLMYPNLVSSGTIGICGAITSWIGVYQNWK